MKILHVLPALTKGGAERVAVDLANASIAAGHEVSMVLAYPVDPALLQDELNPQVDVKFIRPRRSRAASYAAIVPFIHRHRKWLQSHDVVHCHLTYGSIFGSLLSGLTARSPAIVETYHAVGMEIPGWKRALHQLLLKRRDAVVLMAEDSYWRGFRNRHADHVVQLVPNGVSRRPAASQAHVAALRREAGVPADVGLVGSVGRLQHERRPDALVRAFAVAAETLPPSVHLLLGGEGPARAGLAELAHRLGIGDRVHFCGLVLDPAAVFGNLELYLTVNVGPITGIAALEAAMSGLPVVAFQMLSDSDQSDQDWIWSSNDPVALGRNVAALLSDCDVRRALADRQQRFALERHSLEAMADAYTGIYKDALHRRGGRKDANW